MTLVVLYVVILKHPSAQVTIMFVLRKIVAHMRVYGFVWCVETLDVEDMNGATHTIIFV